MMIQLIENYCKTFFFCSPFNFFFCMKNNCKRLLYRSDIHETTIITKCKQNFQVPLSHSITFILSLRTQNKFKAIQTFTFVILLQNVF